MTDTPVANRPRILNWGRNETPYTGSSLEPAVFSGQNSTTGLEQGLVIYSSSRPNFRTILRLPGVSQRNETDPSLYTYVEGAKDHLPLRDRDLIGILNAGVLNQNLSLECLLQQL